MDKVSPRAFTRKAIEDYTVLAHSNLNINGMLEEWW